MRENRPLKVKVCAILTLISLSILVTFLVFLPSLFISDAISFIASGSSLFFPNVPLTHFLWFLPEEFHGLPLSIGQFLDVCVLLIIALQTASTIYILLARFYRYQPASSEIPFELKKKLGEALPNFMRWNILPHGHQFLGEKLGDSKFGHKGFATNYRDFEGTAFEEHVPLSAKIDEGFYSPLSILFRIKKRLLISRYILGSRHQHSLDCNILVSHSDRFVLASHVCRASILPHILAISYFSHVCNPTQKLEVLA